MSSLVSRRVLDVVRESLVRIGFMGLPTRTDPARGQFLMQSSVRPSERSHAWLDDLATCAARSHERDDVFVSTDPSMDAKLIIETFAQRWSLEHTFHECKGKLGFEDPQNRKDHAVERTAPMALWLHTLVVLWYLGTGQHSRAARLPSMPWYTKTAPTFSDMLATLRRASWAERLSIPCANVQTLRKRMRPLIEALAA